MKRQIKNNVSWIGYIDWELETFHGDDYSISHGSSQNAYLIEEEKTVLVDTVWQPHDTVFMDNLKKVVDLNKLDYVVINHGEVDHSGALPALMKERPDLTIICTKNALSSLQGQYGGEDWNYHVVKTGDSLDVGNGKQLVFVEMRMLHWPDSMAAYLTGDNILFSNDAFGQHYAVDGLFNDLADQCLLEAEAIKYYANILTPFSPLVAAKIKEVVGLNLPIDIIAPSHGAIWRDNPLQIIEKYAAWADDYQEDRLTIVYDTMWEGTTELAHRLAAEAVRAYPDTRVSVFNISKSDKNDIMTEVFRSRAIAVGSPTVGNDILSSVAGWIHFLKSLKFKNKKAAAFGCYGWSGESIKKLKEKLADAGFDVVDPSLRVQWKARTDELPEVKEIIGALLG
ncbi:MAG TPA: MBL fold metallo-hydrolase [Clostridiaceae bacterium]|nr:MBL fold metallo-hydrolase [Clostridiaceae bacterium]